MTEFLGFLGILFLIFYLIFPFILNSKLNQLAERIKDLEQKVKEGGKTTPLVTPTPEPIRPIPVEDKSIQVQETISKPQKEIPVITPEPANVKTPSITIGPEPRIQKSPVWEKLERQIADNWTGILGIVILTMGVGFLGIYAALKVTPLFRFLMVLGIGTGLFAASILLVKKEFWKQIGFWIRSGSGAIILFACVGSVAIPGMKWIENELLGLVIIVCGISVNLVLAWFASLQRFASLHIVLSLISLAILPLTTFVFILATGISFFSLVLSYKAKWEYNLLQSVFSFLIFNYIYKNHFSVVIDLFSSPQSRLIGIFGTLLVGIGALLIHYRKIYSSDKFERLPFLTHLAAWGSIGIGLSMYATGSKWNSPILVLSSVFIFFFARIAKKKNIRWLYLTDTLVALGISFIGIIFLGRWQLDSYSIHLLVSLLFVIFFIISSEEKENLLKSIGAALLHFSWTVYLVLLIKRSGGEGNTGSFPIVIISLGMLALAFAIQIYDSVRYEKQSNASDDIYGIGENFKLSPSGIFIGLLSSALCLQVLNWQYAELFVPVFGLFLLLIRQNRDWNGLGIGLIPFLLVIHILVIFRIWKLEPTEFLLNDIPLIVFCFFCIPFSKINLAKGKTLYLSQPGVILFSLHVLFLAYWVSNPISPFLPGILWLILSLLYLEAVLLFQRKEKDRNFNWKVSFSSASLIWSLFAIGFVVLFLGAHFLVHLQSEYSIGILKIRFLIQIFAVGVFLYWATSNASDKDSHTVWKRVLPLFWELSVIFITIILALEIPNNWLPVAWILWAFLLDYAGVRFTDRISRFRFYSLSFFWYSCIHVGFISSSITTPSVYWGDQEWLGGLLAIFLQTFYLIRGYRLPSYQGTETEGFPGAVRRLADKTESKFNILVFYPLFATVAIFLFWSLDSSLLTLLWMVEVFCVFLIGLALKEEHFRYVSLGAMIICLVRLIFWDLSQSSTITRALVFLGVGGILILMNTIYNKYRSKEKTDVQ